MNCHRCNAQVNGTMQKDWMIWCRACCLDQRSCLTLADIFRPSDELHSTSSGYTFWGPYYWSLPKECQEKWTLLLSLSPFYPCSQCGKVH